MLSLLRKQVQSVLYAVSAKRKPALRRSDAANALFATDLTLIAEADAVTTFRAELERLGWSICERDGWLTLDAPVPAPVCNVPAVMTGECGCCISLLLRHPDHAPAEDEIRAVTKAADAGIQPFERVCAQLHADFAVRLRQRQPLPGALLPYLCHAYEAFYK